MKHKRFFIILLFMVLISFKNYGQEILKTYSVDFVTPIALEDKNLIIESSDNKDSKASTFSIKGMEVQGKDLFIYYDLPKIDKEIEQGRYQLSLHFRNGLYNQTIPSSQLSGALSNSLIESPPYSLAWIDFFRNSSYPLDSLYINFEADLIGIPPINCGQSAPQFNFKRYVTISGTGALLTIGGLLLDARSDQLYGDYKQEVFDGNTATSAFNKANNTHKAGYISETGGLVLLAGGIVTGYLDYQFFFKKNKRLYEEYCPRLEIRPSIDPSMDGESNIGINLTLKF